MDDTTILGGALIQLGQTAKQTVKQVVKLPEEMAGDLGRQIGGDQQRPTSEGQRKPDVSGEPKQWQSDEERIKFLKDLYGRSDPSAGSGQAAKNEASDKKPSEFQEQIAEKSPEEQKKLIELRNQLHKENYYDPTFNPVKKQEERPAEKVEQEKKQEMIDLQKKDAKKPPPLAVVREQNKAEQFRGAAG
jgi:hypothetical protein